MAVLGSYRNQLLGTTSRETKVVFISERVIFKRTQLTITETYRRRDVRLWLKLCCLKGFQNNVWRLRQFSLFRSIKDRLVIFCQIIAGNTLIFLNYLKQEKTSQMASSPECLTWMVVGLTESVTIKALNSLTVIAFCRDRNLRKRSTYLAISLAVADMLSGGISTFDLFYDIGEMCNFWGHDPEYWYDISAVLLLWFPDCSLTNITVISLERLNATFWPFRHRTIKKSVYWVLIITVWLTTLLFSYALLMISHHTHKEDYFYYALGSFNSICHLVVCVSYVFIFVKLRFGNQPRHHGAANRERKLTVTLFTVTSLPLLLCLPYVVTTFPTFALNAFPFGTRFNHVALRKLFFKSDIVHYENARFQGSFKDIMSPTTSATQTGSDHSPP